MSKYYEVIDENTEVVFPETKYYPGPRPGENDFAPSITAEEREALDAAAKKHEQQALELFTVRLESDIRNRIAEFEAQTERRVSSVQVLRRYIDIEGTYEPQQDNHKRSVDAVQVVLYKVPEVNTSK